jgi:hypothetical protein
MPTVFAAGRLEGLPITAAYAAQILVAVPVTALTAYLWLRDARFELRACALIISTLLVQPYFMYYDLAWLALPILFLMHDAKVMKLNRLEWSVVGAAWLLPVQAFLTVVYGMTCPLAIGLLIALMAIVVRRYFTANPQQLVR